MSVRSINKRFTFATDIHVNGVFSFQYELLVPFLFLLSDLAADR